MTDEEAALRALLAQVYARTHDAKEAGFEKKQHDFVFHVLEAASELDALHSLVGDPKSYSSQEAEKVLRAVLYHCSGHLVAAARLYDKFIDTFEGDHEENE